MRKGDKVAVVWSCATIFLLFVAVGFLVGAQYVTESNTYFVFQNIVSISYSAMSILAVIALRKYFKLPGGLLILGNVILSVGQLWFLEFRMYHRLLIGLFLLSILYLGYNLLRFFYCRKNNLEFETIQLVDGILPTAFVGGSFLAKAICLTKMIETQFDVPPLMVGIALGLCVVAVILGVIFIKDRWDRREFIGKLAAIFFGTFFVVFAIPLLTLEYTNYAWDLSAGEKKECMIVEKETRNRRKGGDSYHLVVLVDGQELRMDVDRVVYSQYDSGDRIPLYVHEGAFGYSYYEYHLDTVYQYGKTRFESWGFGILPDP